MDEKSPIEVYTAFLAAVQVNGAIVIDGFSFASTSIRRQCDDGAYAVDCSPADDSDSGLSDSAIAGIIIGCVLFVLIVGAVIMCTCQRSKSNTKSSVSEKPIEMDVI